jgi:LuxR family transcriptional regulator, maltose regulon positive regulatory protein
VTTDPASFWTYVIAALRTAVPGIGETALRLLQAPLPTPIQTVLTTLLNDLGALERDAVLVLDDYHVINSPEVHEGMAFLIDHLPSRLHVVIANRADPALSLARLQRGATWLRRAPPSCGSHPTRNWPTSTA